jgi:hypothetical protein
MTTTIRTITQKRIKNVMLRFTPKEMERLLGEKPDSVDLATYLRERVLAAADLRATAAFVVAALSDKIDFEEALELFDKHAQQEAS